MAEEKPAPAKYLLQFLIVDVPVNEDPAVHDSALVIDERFELSDHILPTFLKSAASAPACVIGFLHNLRFVAIRELFLETEFI